MRKELFKTSDPRILRLSAVQNREEVFQQINSNKVELINKVGRTEGQVNFLKNAKRSYKKWLRRNPDHKEQIIAKFSVN